MSRIHRLSVIGVLLFAVACSSTQVPSAPGGGGGGGPSGSGPIPMSYTPDTAHASHASIGAAGGTLTATGADGSRYTLTVPAGALTSATDLSLTPLKDVVVDGTSAGWQVGVQLGPNGTQFLQAVTLDIQTAAGAPSQAAVTLVDGSGTVYVPQSSPTTGASFSADLWHFSDYLVAPLTDGLLGRAADAAIADVQVPAVSQDLQDLMGLWAAARSKQFADAVARLDQALAAAIASFTDAQQGNADPTAGTLYSGLGAYHAAVASGRTNDVGTLQQNVQHVFGTWMRVLDLRYLQAGGDFATLQSLIAPLAQAIDIAAANPFILAGGYVIDPTAEAQKVIDTQLALADQDCDKAHFASGVMELQDIMGGVKLLGLTTPSETLLQNDAATCVPPVVTGIEIVSDTVSATSDYNPNNGQPGATTSDVEPPSPLLVTSSTKITAPAQTQDASVQIDLGAALTGNDTATLDVSGTANAAHPVSTELSCAYGDLGSGGYDAIRIDYDHARAPIKVTVKWTAGSSAGGYANARVSGTVLGTDLGLSGGSSGTATLSRAGMGWTPGNPDPSSSASVYLGLSVGAGDCKGIITQDGSATASANVAVQIAPDPQP